MEIIEIAIGRAYRFIESGQVSTLMQRQGHLSHVVAVQCFRCHSGSTKIVLRKSNDLIFYM